MPDGMVPPGNSKARASILQAIILTKCECPMKRLFLLVLSSLLLGGTATAQPTYAQLVDRAGAQMNQKDFCAPWLGSGILPLGPPAGTASCTAPMAVRHCASCWSSCWLLPAADRQVAGWERSVRRALRPFAGRNYR